MVLILDSLKQCGRWRRQSRMRRAGPFECIDGHANERGKPRSSIDRFGSVAQVVVVLRLTRTGGAGGRFVSPLPFHCESRHNILKFVSLKDRASIPNVSGGIRRQRMVQALACQSQTRLAVTPVIVFTIGHSTRSIADFVRLLKAHGIQRVIDVRTIPRSRHNPQFNRDMLSSALRRNRIRYRHMGGLGGLRHAKRDSKNTGWRNASFRGYADYMQTATFRKNLDRCIELAKSERVVLMCAEGVPWRCHRSLIADALLARGIQASEITSGVRARPHVLTPWAHVAGPHVTYPAATGDSPVSRASTSAQSRRRPLSRSAV